MLRSTTARVAFLAADGVERVEVTKPREPLEAAGARVELVAPRPGEVRAFDHLDPAGTVPVDRSLRDADPGRYVALVLPGGVACANHLRRDPAAVGFVRGVIDLGSPLAAFSYALWLLIEAHAIRGRSVTGPPSIRTDVENAGASWVSEVAYIDGELLTCRGPSDVDYCCRRLTGHLLGQREGELAMRP
jgi:protease I